MVSASRHLLRARDLIDARYHEPLDVPALARVACLSPAQWRREVPTCVLMAWTRPGLEVSTNGKQDAAGAV